METKHSSHTSRTSSTAGEVNGIDSVTCPNCQAVVPLTQALMKKLEEESRARMDAELLRVEKAVRAEAALEISKATAKAEERTSEALAGRMADLEAQVREKSERIKRATAVELELRRHQRELEEREKSVTLEVAREVDAARQQAGILMAQRLTEEFRVREAQTKEQLASMTRTIEDLKRKAEQGSQQLQGEAVEVELETLLTQRFPIDGIIPVNKGVRGADIVQTVRTNAGLDCAAIVWETKNAKGWSTKWLEKVRDDQREAKADLAVIVTNTLPTGIRGIGQQDGVWVCDLANAEVLAMALRAQVLAVQKERVASAGRTTKEASLYDFMTGNEFHQRVVAAVTALSQMKKELDRERSTAIRCFAKRDKQIVAAAGHIAEIYGGAQGIIGAALPPVALLEAADDDGSQEDDGEGSLSA